MDAHRVGHLFDAAIGMPAEAVTDWLKEECGDDTALMEAVKRLLRADAEAGQFLETPLDVVSLVGNGGMAGTSPERFGSYRVLRAIGSGGMGEVWLAERGDGEFEQRVAIKQLAYPTPGLLQRFRQERQILAQLDHPGIARLYDGGADEDGLPYLVMEYVEGEPITLYAQTHALDLRARLDLFLRVCTAVQYAHQNLVVHRDLKPSNILVTAEGHPKLLDFGIAKLLATTDPDTRTATRLMTPGYAAPEQVAGAAITTATDVYALGVLLHELLTGAKPTHDTGAGDPDTARPPSQLFDRKPDRALQRSLRGDLDRIVLTALAADPKRRYASPAELAQDIRLHLDGRPVNARGNDRWYRLRRLIRRRRYLIGALLAIFLVLLAATVVSLQQMRRANEEAARALAVRRMLTGVFEQASPDQTKGRVITATALLDAGVRQIEQSDGDPATRSDLKEVIAGLYTDIGEYDRAQALLDPLLDAASTEVPDAVRLRALIEAVAIAERNGKLDRARSYLDRGDALVANVGGLDPLDVSELRRRRVAIEGMANARAAEPLAREALRLDLLQFGEHSDQAIESWDSLARVLGDLSRYDEAIPASRTALAIARALHGDDNTTVASQLNSLGIRLRVSGRPVEARQPHEEAVAISTRLRGASHPTTLQLEANLLQAMMSAGLNREALPRLEANLARTRETLGNDDQRVAWVLASLSLARLETGDFSGAEQARKEGLQISTKLLGPDNIEVLTTRINLANLLTVLRNYAEAEAILRDVLKRALATLPEGSKHVAYARFRLATALVRSGNPNEAIQLVEPLLDAPAPTSPSAAFILLSARMVLAESLLEQEQLGEAQAAAASVLAQVRGNPDEDVAVVAQALVLSSRVALAQKRPDLALPWLREAVGLLEKEYGVADPRLINARLLLAESLAGLGQRDEAGQLLDLVAQPLAGDMYPFQKQMRGHAQRVASLLLQRSAGESRSSQVPGND